MWNILLAAIAASIPLARAHDCFMHPSMYGYNFHAETFTYDNRPEAPLQQYTFDQWWFHGHLDYPPAKGIFFELPAGDKARAQIACNLGITEFWADSDGHTDLRAGDYNCPGYPTSQFHGYDDLKGCALSIAYTSDVHSIKPEDLAIFSVNHECVWRVNTTFEIPKDMPACPEDGCICAWHWIHSKNSGSAQMYMNGFRCKVTGSTSTKSLMKPEVPKRCTGDFSKCNKGAQQPMYWFQAEGNNMDNGQYDPPAYLEEWGFADGAQNNIFADDNGDSPSTTPVDDKPTPSTTPGTPPIAIESPPNGGNGGNLPKPSSSSSQCDGLSETKTSTSDSHPPTPSKTQYCDDKKEGKRSELASRHLKHRRHHARENNH